MYLTIKRTFLVIIPLVTLLALTNSCNKVDALEDSVTSTKEAFINKCIEELVNSQLNELEKSDACVCNHDNLYTKYGKETYKEGHVTEFEDSVEKLQCYMQVYKQKLHRIEREQSL